MSNYHRKGFGKLVFPLCQSELGNYGLLLVFVRVWESFVIGGNMVASICELITHMKKFLDFDLQRACQYYISQTE